MPSMRELMDIAEGKKLPQHERLAIYHFATDDAVAALLIHTLLTEAVPSVDLGKGRSIMFHKAHVPNTQDHLHFLVKGDKFAAINKDGSAHDASHGIKLQRWAIDGAKQYYPDFKMPKGGLIEQVYGGEATQILIEAAGYGDTLSPAAQLLALTEALKA